MTNRSISGDSIQVGQRVHFTYYTTSVVGVVESIRAVGIYKLLTVRFDWPNAGENFTVEIPDGVVTPFLGDF